MYSALGFTENCANPMRAPAPSMKSRGLVYQPPNALQPIGAASAGAAASTMAPPMSSDATKRGIAMRGIPKPEDFIMVGTSLLLRHARPEVPAARPPP